MADSLRPSMSKSPGPPREFLPRGIQKQLDELNIVCTKKEEETAE